MGNSILVDEDCEYFPFFKNIQLIDDKQTTLAIISYQHGTTNYEVLKK